jgi:hypothetical protein
VHDRGGTLTSAPGIRRRARPRESWGE